MDSTHPSTTRALGVSDGVAGFGEEELAKYDIPSIDSSRAEGRLEKHPLIFELREQVKVLRIGARNATIE